jgi:hypothetical protein
LDHELGKCINLTLLTVFNEKILITVMICYIRPTRVYLPDRRGFLSSTRSLCLYPYLLALWLFTFTLSHMSADGRRRSRPLAALPHLTRAPSPRDACPFLARRCRPRLSQLPSVSSSLILSHPGYSSPTTKHGHGCLSATTAGLMHPGAPSSSTT